ncbi:ATP synthase F1 subunit epsilon [bacterium]|nr:ATP synthase F1 subunit epsilon [bacterium]
MASDFAVKVVTPDGEVWSGRAVSVIVPGLDGYFGVWQGHAPLVAGMGIGTLSIKTPGEVVVDVIAVSGGFVEVSREGVTILAEAAEMGGSIDTIRASESETRARERLSGKFANIDIERAQVALRKAANRRRAAELARSRPTSMV